MQTIFYNGWYTNIDYGLGSLTADERKHNGMKLAQHLYNFHWTENAIAGILGNVEGESGMNPGSMENSGGERPWSELPTNEEVLESSYLRGMGFTQWTPGRDKIVQFAEDTGRIWYDGITQVFRLKWECDNGYQMGGWQWYINNTGDPADLAEYFLRQYERPTPEQIEATLANRRAAATRWYGWIHGKLFNNKLLWYNKRRKELKPRWQKI